MSKWQMTLQHNGFLQEHGGRKRVCWCMEEEKAGGALIYLCHLVSSYRISLFELPRTKSVPWWIDYRSLIPLFQVSLTLYGSQWESINFGSGTSMMHLSSISPNQMATSKPCHSIARRKASIPNANLSVAQRMIRMVATPYFQ